MSLITPVPNGPFYSPASYNVSTPSGSLVLGSGLAVTAEGTLLVSSALGGTVSSVTAGIGLSANGGSPGGTITTVGTIQLLPANSSTLGGVKSGANVTIAADGTISVAPPGIGTITGVFGSGGITGGGTVGTVTLSLQPASNVQFGGVQVGAGINSTGGLISLVPASTTAVGGVQLATASEVIAGANPAKAVTPATLAAKVASTLAPGIVQLSDNASLTNSTLAATPTAVKTAYDAAVAAQVTASAALPKAGGTMAGVIVFSPSQTFPGVSFPVATTNSLGVISVGPGLAVNSSGVLSTANVGTVTGVTAGPGLGNPATGGTISTSGTIRLLAPTTDGLQLGGVKAGSNINIAFDGTISVPGSNFIASNNQYAYNSYIWPIPNAPGPGPIPLPPCPGQVGQVLSIANQTTGQLIWKSAGTLSSVVAGPGLTVTSTPTTATVSLTTIPSITPGAVGGTALIPTLSVNAQGQIISTGLANPYPPFQIATITAPPNLVLDFSSNMTNWEYTIAGNLTIDNPLNALPGMRGGMLLRQDPSTPFALTWGSSWKFANNTPAPISNVAAAVDYFEFVVVASNYIIVTAYLNGLG